jgi:GH15 family glucan-1,4-alpha-glucosidase
LIGDAQSAALVASDGEIDWLCLPHFDSPAVLCRILDAGKGGFLALRPRAAVTETTRNYLPASTVLRTTLFTEEGALTLTDTMPVAWDDFDQLLDSNWTGKGRHRLIRLLQSDTADLTVELEARIGFDFGATIPEVELVPGKGAILAGGHGRFLTLAWPGELRHEGGGLFVGAVTLQTVEPLACVLAYSEDRQSALALLDESDWTAQVEVTDRAWKKWATTCAVTGPYRDKLIRSVLTLKLLTFEPTGAIVAAPTTSLPERIGGVRNWDYRYCWLRDATLTLYALLMAGERGTAHAFWNWIKRTCAEPGPERMRIMYGIHGESELHERELSHLSGYRDSSPVWVGNGAWHQRQLDVYGELLDAYTFYHEHVEGDGPHNPVDPELWTLLRAVADYICEIWREKDHGLWEVRGEPRHFTYSKVMCWVGLDRAVQLAAENDLPCERERWARERELIRAEIMERGYSETAGSFTMAYGTDQLDAALLRLPLVGFLPADDPRMRATIERIRDELGHDGLLWRYVAEDGLPPGEGAFAICSFWLVDCLTALGELDEAQALFERMLGYANDLGLFAEEIDPATGAALGNFPQAFTHLALVDAGIDLTAALAKHAPIRGDTAARARQARDGTPPNG